MTSKTSSIVLVTGLLLLGGLSTEARAQNYGAIAFSPTTGAHGLSYDYP